MTTTAKRNPFMMVNHMTNAARRLSTGDIGEAKHYIDMAAENLRHIEQNMNNRMREDEDPRRNNFVGIPRPLVEHLATRRYMVRDALDVVGRLLQFYLSHWNLMAAEQREVAKATMSPLLAIAAEAVNDFDERTARAMTEREIPPPRCAYCVSYDHTAASCPEEWEECTRCGRTPDAAGRCACGC